MSQATTRPESAREDKKQLTRPATLKIAYLLMISAKKKPS
jgi:hypothetical protein